MSFEEQTSRIETLIWLINCNKTDTAQVLAKRPGVSRRTVFNDLEFPSDSHTADSYFLEK